MHQRCPQVLLGGCVSVAFFVASAGRPQVLETMSELGKGIGWMPVAVGDFNLKTASSLTLESFGVGKPFRCRWRRLVFAQL
jgi:hypothetical protein